MFCVLCFFENIKVSPWQLSLPLSLSPPRVLESRWLELCRFAAFPASALDSLASTRLEAHRQRGPAPAKGVGSHPYQHLWLSNLITPSPIASSTMSFNDLERGTTNPPQTSHSAAVGGSRDGSLRGSPRPGRPKSSTPLPLYHAPGGSSSISPQDDDDEGSSSALTPAQTAEIKKLSDSIGAQIFKINSNTAAVQKLLKLADANRTVPSKPATAQGDRDWTKKA